MREYRIGTRESRLAMWQAQWVANQLMALRPGVRVSLVGIKTKGDHILDTALAKIGDKGLFTKELETALLNGQVDMAVHSMKDLPTTLPGRLVLGAICERECPADVLIAKKGLHLEKLRAGAVIGTSSLRRIAQLKKYRRDLVPVDIRGNLDTRLRKMEEQGLDALVLAYAGIVRLGHKDKIVQQIPYDICLPAVGQGAIGIEAREEDHELLGILTALDHAPTRQAVTSERALLRRLEGGCQIPVGAMAVTEGNQILLEAMVSSLDGLETIRMAMRGTAKDSEGLGVLLAEKMLSQGADGILRKVRQEFDSNDS